MMDERTNERMNNNVNRIDRKNNIMPNRIHYQYTLSVVLLSTNNTPPLTVAGAHVDSENDCSVVVVVVNVVAEKSRVISKDNTTSHRIDPQNDPPIMVNHSLASRKPI